MNTNKLLAKNTLIIFLGKAFTQLLSFLLLPLYTSYLSTEDFGLTDVIFTIGSLLAPIIILQLDAGLFRALIDYRGNSEQTKKITKSIFYVSSLLVLTSSILYIIALRFYEIQYGKYLLGYIIATIYLNLTLQYFRGIGENVTYSILCCVNGAAIILLNILFIVMLRLGAKGMLLAYIIGESITACVGGITICIRGRNVHANWNIKEVKPILGYSIPLIFNGVSWWIMNLSDRLIISAVLSYSCNGIYAVSNKFSSVLFSLYSIFNISWTEVVSLKYVGNSFDKDVININKKICGMMLSICIFVISCMYIVFPLLINENYLEGYKYIPILIIAVYLNCLGAQIGGLMVAIKDSKSIAETSLIGAVTNIAINVIFIKYIGLYAASISTLLAYLAMFLLRYKKIGNGILKFSIKGYGWQMLLFTVSLVCYYLNNSACSTLNLLFVSIIFVYSYKQYAKKVIKRIIMVVKR